MSKIANVVFSVAVVLCSFLSSLLAFSQDGSPNGTCSFQTLHLPDNTAGFDTVEAINDIGAIVGTVVSANEQQFHAYLLFDGKFSPFKFPGSLLTAAHDINNHARIVGEYTDSPASCMASWCIPAVFARSMFLVNRIPWLRALMIWVTWSAFL
jgi:hypothetical protein